MRRHSKPGKNKQAGQTPRDGSSSDNDANDRLSQRTDGSKKTTGDTTGTVITQAGKSQLSRTGSDASNGGDVNRSASQSIDGANKTSESVTTDAQKTADTTKVDGKVSPEATSVVTINTVSELVERPEFQYAQEVFDSLPEAEKEGFTLATKFTLATEDDDPELVTLGYYNPESKKIVLRKGMSVNDAISTLIYELYNAENSVEFVALDANDAVKGKAYGEQKSDIEAKTTASHVLKLRNLIKEHGMVFPGARDVAALKRFEGIADDKVHEHSKYLMKTTAHDSNAGDDSSASLYSHHMYTIDQLKEMKRSVLETFMKEKDVKKPDSLDWSGSWPTQDKKRNRARAYDELIEAMILEDGLNANLKSLRLDDNVKAFAFQQSELQDPGALVLKFQSDSKGRALANKLKAKVKEDGERYSKKE